MRYRSLDFIAQTKGHFDDSVVHLRRYAHTIIEVYRPTRIAPFTECTFNRSRMCIFAMCEVAASPKSMCDTCPNAIWPHIFWSITTFQLSGRRPPQHIKCSHTFAQDMRSAGCRQVCEFLCVSGLKVRNLWCDLCAMTQSCLLDR